MADMDAHQAIVSAALAAKSSAETPKKACWNARSEAMSVISSLAVAPRPLRLRSALVVLVVAPPPDARFVAPAWRTVEPLVHAPEAVHSARIGGIGVVDDAILERERAYAGPLARVRGRVGSRHGREHDRPLAVALPGRLAAEVVFDAPLALLLLGESNAEVGVKVADLRGPPGKRTPHPPLVCLQLRERRPRHRPKHDVVVGQVHGEPVEAVRDRRAGRTPRLVVGPEHEVVDEELRAPSEEVCQRGAPLVGLESILLVDPNPRQLLPPLRQLVAAPRELLLRLEQLEPRGEPLVTCPGHVLRHCSSLLPAGVAAPHRSPLIFSARMPVKCFQPSSWPRPISSSGSPLCVNTRSVAPRDGVISMVTRDSSPRVASDIHANSNSRGRSTRR